MRRREMIVGGAAWALVAQAEQQQRVGVVLQGGAHFAGVTGLREALSATRFEHGAQPSLLVREGKAIFTSSKRQRESLKAPE